ncbi:MFS transporter [Rhizorhabdus phycosphaerae]|uniref:MFS transporter n=1 Tax=Rhizorhabdus phycosphaerae TaxID=2711156 RepID=UPI0013EAB9B9|nr:MFS transporter [Rhizorhabdus phycosphaerae]
MSDAHVSALEREHGYWKGISTPRRWSTLGFLFLAATLNLLDRQVVNILAEQIKIDLRLNDAELGLLTGTAFGLMYAFFTIPMSRLSDHVSRTRLIAAAMSIWSILTICCGLAANFVQLALARMGVGIGEAGSQSASASLIVDCFPPRQRGLATAIFYLGVPVGGCLGMLIGAVVATSFGWRAAFLFAGAPGLLLGLLMWLALRDPRAATGRNFAEVIMSLHLGHAIRRLAAIRAYRLSVIASIAGISIYYVVQAWLPVYFVRVHRMSMIDTALWMSIAMATGGSVGSIGSGWACDRLRPHIQQPECVILILSLLAVGPALALTTLTSNKTVAIVGLCLTYPFAFGFLTPGTLLIQKAAPEKLRGIAIGLWASVTNVISLTIVVPAVGLTSDILKPDHGVRSLALALAASSVVAILGAGVMMMAKRELNKSGDASNAHPFAPTQVKS